MESLLEIKDNIEKNYNLKIRSMEKEPSSTEKNVYILNCKDGKYVAKAYKNIEHTNIMCDLQGYLNKIGLNVPEIIKTKKKSSYIKIEERYIVIYSFLKGEQVGQIIKNNMLDNQTIALIANKIRELHNVTKNKDFNLPESTFANKLERKSVLHYDLTKDNIFVYNGNIGFIDFDDAVYGDSVCDIAIAILFLFISKSRGIDINGIKVFIDSYYGDNIYLKLLETPLIKEYADEWIKSVIGKDNLDNSIIESFKYKRKQIKYIET